MMSKKKNRAEDIESQEQQPREESPNIETGTNDYLFNTDRFTFKAKKIKPYYPLWVSIFLFSFLCMGMIAIVSLTYFLLKTSFITVYGAFVLSYYALQMLFAELYRRYVYPKFKKKYPLDEYFKVGIQAVGYREDPMLFKQCIESITKISHKNKTVVVSVDGDTDEDKFMFDIAEEILSKTDIEYKILMNVHGGKRSALFYSYMYLRDKVDFVITTDSDSALPTGLCNLCVPMVEDPKIMVTCGEVFISNWRDSFLTKILVPRYYVAFILERSCFSYFNVMNCASGPIGCYRASFLRNDHILENELLNQVFLWCSNCHVGDDRHMTVCALRYGNCVSIPYIEAKSDSPNTLKKFAIQQVRWTKSYFRETLLEIESMRYHHIAYMIMVSFGFTFSFILICYLILLLLSRKPWYYLVISVLIMIFVNFIRSLYLYAVSKRKIMLLYIFYLPYYLCLILPIRLYVSLGPFLDAKAWLTKGSEGSQLLVFYRTYGHYFVVIPWNMCLLGLFGWWLYYQITN